MRGLERAIELSSLESRWPLVLPPPPPALVSIFSRASCTRTVPCGSKRSWAGGLGLSPPILPAGLCRGYIERRSALEPAPRAPGVPEHLTPPPLSVLPSRPHASPRCSPTLPLPCLCPPQISLNGLGAAVPRALLPLHRAPPEHARAEQHLPGAGDGNCTDRVSCFLSFFPSPTGLRSLACPSLSLPPGSTRTVRSCWTWRTWSGCASRIGSVCTHTFRNSIAAWSRRGW